MKNSFLMILVLVLAIAGCSEDPDDVNVVETDSSLSVDLSGEMNVTYEDDSLVAYTHANLIIIKAYDASENTLWIMLDGQVAGEVIGMHDVGRFEAPVQINFNLADGSASFSAESGSVTISRYEDNYIEGTFSFEATNFSQTEMKINGTNGQFSAQIK